MDAAAKAAVAGPAFAPAYFIFLNIDGPLRFTTFGQNVTLSGTGDSELNGTYTAWAGQFLEISDVSNSESGSDTLNVALSGIVSIDTGLINDIGDRSKWQGRLCRIWFRVYDETGTTPQGAIVPLYTGYLSSVKITSEPEQQIIHLNVENWLAAFNQPSNRSYMGQKDYDANDTSPQATLAAANGMRRDTGAGAGGAPAPNIKTEYSDPYTGDQYFTAPGDPTGKAMTKSVPY